MSSSDGTTGPGKGAVGDGHVPESGWPRPESELAHVRWADLRAAALEVVRRAYVPYSGYQVGVAGQGGDGRVYVGCNVENASLGVTLCAECGMVSDLVRAGGGKLIGVVCVDGEGTPLVPCGRCRQLLFEHGGPDLLLSLDRGVYRLAHLLPQAFGPDHLAQASERRAALAESYLRDNPADPTRGSRP